MRDIHWYTCILHEGINARGKILHTCRLKASSEDDARHQFCDKNKYKFPISYLVIECGDKKVGGSFYSPRAYKEDEWEDEDEDEEDDWEDEEEEDTWDDEEEEDYDDEEDEDYDWE